MNTETLITILAVLLGLNFLIWLGIAIFLFIQIKRIFKRINLFLDNFTNFSSTLAGSALKIGALIFGLLKGFRTVQSINTLSDLFDSEEEDDDVENVKKKK